MTQEEYQQQSSPTIYYLKNEDILNKDILEQYIYPNEKNNYYWSDDFSEEFYINLAHAGFITVSSFFEDKFVLLPELQYEYALLHFDDLHISKKVQKLLNNASYELSINQHFNEVLTKLNTYHKECWVEDKYITLMKKLKNHQHPCLDFKLLSVELICKRTNQLIAAELGYKIGSVYTSLTGFCSKEKAYNNWGKLQMVLWALYLKEKNFSFWNLGHPFMEYKTSLGAKNYSRVEFLSLLQKAYSIT